jgi:N-acetylmuramoyl-L-alanine amidase
LHLFKKLFLFTLIFNCYSNLFAIEILNYRFGIEKNIHRVVIDISKDITFNYISKEKKLTITLYKEISKAEPFKENKNLFVKKILIKPKKKQIEISFRSDFKIKDIFLIKGNKSKKARIVIDVEKLKVVSRKKVIVIDAGHGGKDSGAIGINKILEKNVTLTVAKKLKGQLEKQNFKVILTRNSDLYIKLRKRVRVARDYKSDLFISLHADYHKNKKVHGVSVYTLSEKASDKEAEALARRENKEDLIDGLDLSVESKEVTNILIDLAQRETMNQSSYFVNFLLEELKHKTKLLQRTHRFAGFAVLKAPDIPSVLIEMGYLSNRNDAKLLTNSIYHDKLVDGITKAIEKYFLWKEKK